MWRSKCGMAFWRKRVPIGPGSIRTTAMPEPASSRRSASVRPSSANLRGDVGAAPGGGDEAEDRGDHHDAAVPGGAHRRQQAVGEVELAEEVGLEDRAERGARQVLGGAGDREGAVVDERVEAAAGAVERLGGGGREAGLVGEVEREALEALGRQAGAVGGLAAGGEDAPAAGGEGPGGVEADAGGAAGDEDAAALRGHGRRVRRRRRRPSPAGPRTGGSWVRKRPARPRAGSSHQWVL